MYLYQSSLFPHFQQHRIFISTCFCSGIYKQIFTFPICMMDVIRNAIGRFCFRKKSPRISERYGLEAPELDGFVT